MKHQDIIAHRGAWGNYPQNSLEAAREAIRQGADWIECDVRVLADGQAVVHHNFWHGTHWLSHLTLEQLRGLPGGADVPTLAEWVEAISGGARMLVEIKTPDAVDAALAILVKVPVERFMIQSFSGAVIEEVALRRPDIQTCWLELMPVRRWRKSTGPHMVALFWPYALLGGAWRASRAGKAVRVWVVNWRWLDGLVRRLPAVSGIITDRPGYILASRSPK